MIQRIQSLYLIISIFFLGALLSGMTILRFYTLATEAKLTVFGLTYTSNEVKFNKSDFSFALFIPVLALIVIHLTTLFYFRRLKNQLKWIQYTFLIYVVLGWLLLMFSFFGSDWILHSSKVTPGVGLPVFLLGIPFTYMALKSIKKDKALIDSVDRIR